MNLLADMAQPADDAAGGPDRSDAVGRRDGADLDDHGAGQQQLGSAGQPGHDHRHGDRRRRRRGRRRRGVDRQRRDLASARTGRGTWTYTWTAGSSGTLHAAQPRGRRQRQPRDARHRRHGHGRQRQPGLPVQHLGQPAATPAKAGRDDRQHRGRGRREVPLADRGPDHRRPLLQGRDEHRHARRPPVDAHGPAARDRDVHERDGDAAGRRRASRRPVDITAGTTYVASYHAPNGNYASNLDYFAAAGVDSGAAARAARRRGRRQRRLRLRCRAARSRPASGGRRTTGSTSCSRPARDTTAPTRHGREPRARGATNVADVGRTSPPRFSEAVDPATVNANTVLLRDAGGRRRARGRHLRRRQPDRDARPDRDAGRLHDLHGDGQGRHGRRQGPRGQRARDRRQLDVHDARAVPVRLPVQHLGRARRRPPSAPRRRHAARSRSARGSAPRPTGSSPGCASTRARRTPARTSATCGRSTGPAARDGDVHERDRDAAGSRSRSPRRSRSRPTRPTSPRTTRRTATTR